MQPTKCPAREKKGPEKRKKRGGEGKTKSKRQDCCVTFKPCGDFFRKSEFLSESPSFRNQQYYQGQYE